MFRTLLPGLQPARYGIVALLFAGSLHAADWIALRAAGVELVSDAGEKTARGTLQRFAEIRSVLPAATNLDRAPLRIFLFAKESEYRAYAPNASADGFYQSGFDRDSIVMHVGSDLPRVAAHEYVHFATHRRDVVQPVWLNEGLAEFYSNFDGRQLGRPIAEHLKLLEQPWHTAAEMNRPQALDLLFYAQSWALVHMLRREASFPEVVTEAMLEQLRLYLKTMRGSAIPARKNAVERVAAEPISSLNSLLLRADLALHGQKLDLARTLYAQAAREFPNSSAAAAGLGAISRATGDIEAALRQLKHAIELNDQDALAWLELALVTNDSAALERAARLNPNLAEAHVLLGVRATDEGRLEAALQHLEQATRVTPRAAYAWYSLGYALWKSGKYGEARTALEQALGAATSPEQRAMASTLLDALER